MTRPSHASMDSIRFIGRYPCRGASSSDGARARLPISRAPITSHQGRDQWGRRAPMIHRLDSLGRAVAQPADDPRCRNRVPADDATPGVLHSPPTRRGTRQVPHDRRIALIRSTNIGEHGAGRRRPCIRSRRHDSPPSRVGRDLLRPGVSRSPTGAQRRGGHDRRDGRDGDGERRVGARACVRPWGGARGSRSGVSPPCHA